MNVLFVIFIVCVTSTVNAERNPCDGFVVKLFKIIDKLMRMFTTDEIASLVYSDALKAFFYESLSPWTVQFLQLPVELNMCKKLATFVADKPQLVSQTSIRHNKRVIRNILYDYDTDLDDICEILPEEGEKYLKKVKNLIDNTPATNNATLDNFCTANVSICNVTDDASFKLVAYLSAISVPGNKITNGFDPDFLPFVEMIRSEESFVKFQASLERVEPFASDYNYCVGNLTNFAVQTILNATLGV